MNLKDDLYGPLIPLLYRWGNNVQGVSVRVQPGKHNEEDKHIKGRYGLNCELPQKMNS